MKVAELFARMRADVEAAEKSNVATIPTAKLLEYFTLLEQELASAHADDAHALEQHRLRLQQWIARLEARTAAGTEMFKAIIESGREAIKAVMIMNGAAAVAVLGYLANGAATGSPDRRGMAVAVLLYALGVFSGGAAYAARYFSQYFYGEASELYDTPGKEQLRTNYWNWADRWRWATVGTVMLAGALFLAGCVTCYITLRS
jgi:hypothetical protein